MDQHPVPRQITTFEFKLIGFMTLRQFLFLAIFFPIGFIIYKVIPIPYINILLGVLVAGVGILFAFVEIQDRPLEIWLKNFLKRLNSPTQFIYKKHGDTSKLLEGLYFASDPHLALTHVETKAKLDKYLDEKKIKEKIPQEDSQESKKRTHIDSLLKETVNTDPTAIKKADVSLSASSKRGPDSVESQIKEPFVTGIIKNKRQIPLPGILVSIQDPDGNQLRLLKTNPHGIFATYSPLSAGDYNFAISDPKGNYFFDTIKMHLEPEDKKPLLFYSKEMI